MSGFFVRPWEEPVASLTDDVQAWLVNQAGFELRALGRLTEAVRPMRAGLEFRKRQEDWKNAAISAGNLSELSLTLGDVSDAVASAEESVELADRSGDDFQRMGMRTALADALHQAGRLEESAASFREAEAMQREGWPNVPYLTSLRGYRYCDLLLGLAQADLDEAREIAERGGMRLHLCDVHLEGTRQHLASGGVGEARRRLGEAKGLVEACGYGRRAGEVTLTLTLSPVHRLSHGAASSAGERGPEKGKT